MVLVFSVYVVCVWIVGGSLLVWVLSLRCSLGLHAFGVCCKCLRVWCDL